MGFCVIQKQSIPTDWKTCHTRCRVMMRKGSSPCCTFCWVPCRWVDPMKVVGWGLRCLDGPDMLEHMSKERQAGKVFWMIVGFWKHVSNPIPLDLVSNGFHMTTISKKHVQQMWGSQFFLGPQFLLDALVPQQPSLPWFTICNAVFTRFACLSYCLAQSFTSTTSMAWGQKIRRKTRVLGPPKGSNLEGKWIPGYSRDV